MLALNLTLAIYYCLAIIIALGCHWWTDPMADTSPVFCMVKESLEVTLLVLFIANARPRRWPRYFSFTMPSEMPMALNISMDSEQSRAPPSLTHDYCEASINPSSYDQLTKSNRSFDACSIQTDSD